MLALDNSYEGIVEIYEAYSMAKNQAVILESSKYA